MSGYTLTWKAGAGPRPLDAAFLRPDTLGGLDRDALSAFPVWVGRRRVPLADLVEIEGQAGPRLTLRGVPPLPRLGAGMAAGELIVEGDAGDDLGASMRGGFIRVRGSAGHRAGGPDFTSDRGMTGGRILIEGDAGDHLGHRMRRGVLAVRGRVGASPGYRMMAGTILLGAGPLDHPGLEMRRGTIVALHDATVADSPGSHLVEAGFFPTGTVVALRLLLRYAAGAMGLAPVAIDARYRLFHGDRFELGKGELWIRAD